MFYVCFLYTKMSVQNDNFIGSPLTGIYLNSTTFLILLHYDIYMSGSVHILYAQNVLIR